MKVIKQLVNFVCAVFLLAHILSVAFASQINGGFISESITSEEFEIYLKNIDAKVIDSVPDGATIECFSVSENERIAIGFNTSPRKTVCVLDSKGNFQYGLTFNCSGSFALDWDKDCFIVLSVRGNIAAKYDTACQCVSIVSILNTAHNQSEWNRLLSETQQQVGDKIYCLESNAGLFSVSYSNLISYDNWGNQETIYDTGIEDLSLVLICIIILVSFIAVIVVFIRKRTCM